MDEVGCRPVVGFVRRDDVVVVDRKVVAVVMRNDFNRNIVLNFIWANVKFQ